MEICNTENFSPPLGIQAVEKCCPCHKVKQKKKENAYRFFILILTFFAYCAYHTSRRPLSVVKNVLKSDCSQITRIPDNTTDVCPAWEPFSGRNANQLLGYLDSCFLFAYAIFMFLSGIIAERANLRHFLSIGMVLSGVFTCMFGLAKVYNIHSYYYFAFVQVAGGIVQTTGFPSVVACVGNWFGKTRRGLIFGIWNAHLYVGNMLGAYIAGMYVEEDWAYSFIVPGLFVGGLGIIVFFFLIPYPENVGCSVQLTKPPLLTSSQDQLKPNGLQHSNHPGGSEKSSLEQLAPPLQQLPTEDLPLMKNSPSTVSLGESRGAITFVGALKIPGVLEFSLCLFFAKLVSYTFLFWLPMYIDSKTQMGSEDSAYLSVPFDAGGIIGGILAGLLSDKTGASAVTCTVFIILTIPMLFIYHIYGNVTTIINICLQVICGALVNGPYALITTAVAAELGTHKSILESSKALATVTAIIDGTGSIGAAVGPLLAGVISETGWDNVFYMMMVSAFLAFLALTRVTYRECCRIYRRRGYSC